MTDPDGGRFTYTFDAKNRLAVLNNPQAERTGYAYDAIDRVLRQQAGNGCLTSNTYDAANQ